MTVTILHLDWETAPREDRLRLMIGESSPDKIAIAKRLLAKKHYKEVCEVTAFSREMRETRCLEWAYTLTQNGVISDSWTMEPPTGVKPLVRPHKRNGREYGHRSTSMGDMMRMGDKLWIVAQLGFEELPE